MTAAAAAVAKQLARAESVRRWVVDAEIDAGARLGTTSAEHAEIKALKAIVRRLEEDNAFLKAATTFFVGELDSRTVDDRSVPEDDGANCRGLESAFNSDDGYPVGYRRRCRGAEAVRRRVHGVLAITR